MSNIERIPIVSRADWLELRKKDVTASVAGALLGVHDFTTPFSLWAMKSGLNPESTDDNAVLKRGRMLEPVAIEFLKEKRPMWRDIASPAAYFRDPEVRLGATPDLLAVDENGRRGVVQIKTVEPGIFRKKWKDPDTGEIRPPLWVSVQALVEAYLTGAEWAEVAAMVVSFGIDLHVIPIPIHAELIERIREATVDFWKRVETKRAPDADYERDGALLCKMLGQDNGVEIDLSGDNELPSLAEEHERLSKQKTAAEKRIKAINAEIIAKMGEATTARFKDGVITAKTVRRKPYSVGESSYRTPRITITAVAQEMEDVA